MCEAQYESPKWKQELVPQWILAKWFFGMWLLLKLTLSFGSELSLAAL